MPPDVNLTWMPLPLAAGGDLKDGEMWCDTERHAEKFEPLAQWLELLVRIEGEVITVHKAWMSCQECHELTRQTYQPSDVPRETSTRGELMEYCPNCRSTYNDTPEIRPKHMAPCGRCGSEGHAACQH